VAVINSWQMIHTLLLNSVSGTECTLLNSGIYVHVFHGGRPTVLDLSLHVVYQLPYMNFGSHFLLSCLKVCFFHFKA
jgi:hypothetical protein